MKPFQWPPASPVLPIDALLPEIARHVATSRSLILQAAPGAGKTTRVPPALLDVCEGIILVLEPRRLAARLSAERVASELGEACGETVGFQIRFESVASKRTRIKYITEGLFLRYVLSDPRLSGVGCVVLDEFHERHIHTDVALALVRRLQQSSRPDLKLVVMSATLNAAALADFLPDAPHVVSEGRAFPVEIEHLPRPDARPTEVLVAAAVAQLVADPRCPGHILVFLPGAAEIRRSAAELAPTARELGFDIHELRADLSFPEQQRIFAPSQRRKVILSTNVAETSLTIEGVTGVIDSGLAKIAGHASWSGMPTLDVKPVSQASCVQRAGRAGRTAPGVAKRLFTQFEFQVRPAFEKPEIARLDLTQIILELTMAEELFAPGVTDNPAAAGTTKQTFDILALPWFDTPSSPIVSACTQTLTLLGALDAQGHVTPVGREMARYPLHPRLARVAVEGARRDMAGPALLAAVLLNEGMLFKKGVEAPDYAHCDVSFQARIFQALLTKQTVSPRLAQLTDMVTVRRVESLVHALCGVARVPFRACLEPFDENALSRVLLSGFPDRVAQVRSTRGKPQTGAGAGGGRVEKVELNLCNGGGAVLARTSVVRDSPFLIALDAEESRAGGSLATATQIRVASGIEQEDLLEGHGDLLKETRQFIWDEQAERVRGFDRILYGSLVIDEAQVHGWHAAFENALAKALRAAWPRPFDDASALDFYGLRCRILRENGLAFALPDFNGADFELLVAHICEGKKSFAEIAARDLGDYMSDLLPYEAQKALDELAPEKITIGAGRRVTVHYEDGKPPWVESRLQDFFGTLKTPTVGRGRVPLIVHLLAPNGQAVQVTKDLEGFWERVYPDVRRELSRRYPRHSWPEDPKTALPPEPRGRRR